MSDTKDLSSGAVSIFRTQQPDGSGPSNAYASGAGQWPSDTISVVPTYAA